MYFALYQTGGKQVIPFCFVMSFSDAPLFFTALSHSLFNNFTSSGWEDSWIQHSIFACILLLCHVDDTLLHILFAFSYVTLLQVSIPKLDFPLSLL